MRIGQGYDVHRLVQGRPLVLGGVDIPFDRGLLGHSDADVLTHAVCDSLLGAAGLEDIGAHFPDSDPEYKGISSIILLSLVGEKLKAAGFRVGNIDITVIAEVPKISPYREQMKQQLSAALGVNPSCINIKGTTTEGLGAMGRQEGIAAMCIAILFPHTTETAV